MISKQGARSRSKNQHWVPQFYLRYFATPVSRKSKQPQAWIFSKKDIDGDETLCNIRNICGKRYLYSPIQAGGERNWELDERLDSLESLLGGIWPEIVQGFISFADEDVRKGLALFVAVMHLRNPDVRKGIERLHHQIVSLYKSAQLLPSGTPKVSSLEIEGRVFRFDLQDWDAYRNWKKTDHDRFFTHFVQSEATNIANLLLEKRWSVVFTDADTFITTDKPVVVQHQSRAQYGIGTKDTIITFPLSPTRLLIMDDMHEQPSNQYYPLEKSNAGAFNFSVWQGASRFMVTGRSIPEVLAEICSVADYSSDP